MFHVEQSEFWASGSVDGAAARIAEKLSNKEKEPPPPGNLKLRKVYGKAEKFRTELDCEQIVCSTWNNRSFRVWEAGMGRRLGLRRN